VCYGCAIMAFISNMYDDSILVRGGVFWPPFLVECGGHDDSACLPSSAIALRYMAASCWLQFQDLIDTCYHVKDTEYCKPRQTPLR
jgi:hypothetical protein